MFGAFAWKMTDLAIIELATDLFCANNWLISALIHTAA